MPKFIDAQVPYANGIMFAHSLYSSSHTVMYGCETWIIKRLEHPRIDAFELWCWKRLLRVPWIARRSNQSILREISPEYSLERLMLKLKLQYFGHLIQRADSLEKALMLGKIEGGRRRGQQRTRWWNGINISMNMSLSKALGNGEGQGNLMCCSPWGRKESGWVTKPQKQQIAYNT